MKFFFIRILQAFYNKVAVKIPGMRGLLTKVFSWLAPKRVIQIPTNLGPFWLDFRDRGSAVELLLSGAFEDLEVKVLEDIIRPGMTVVDVGAHMGYFTLLAARAAGVGGRVYAFEPDPEIYKVLRKNVEFFNGENKLDITTVQMALGDKDGGVLRLHRDAVNLGNASFSGANIPADHQAGSVEVPVTTLDAYFSKNGLEKFDVMKIDVQGAEGLVFQGAKSLLSKGPVKILMEFWPYGLSNLGTDPRQMLEFLAGCGFVFKILDRRDGVLKPATIDGLLKISGNRPNGKGWANVLCEKN